MGATTRRKWFPFSQRDWSFSLFLNSNRQEAECSNSVGFKELQGDDSGYLIVNRSHGPDYDALKKVILQKINMLNSIKMAILSLTFRSWRRCSQQWIPLKEYRWKALKSESWTGVIWFILTLNTLGSKYSKHHPPSDQRWRQQQKKQLFGIKTNALDFKNLLIH